MNKTTDGTGWPYAVETTLTVEGTARIREIDGLTTHMYPFEWKIAGKRTDTIQWGNEWIARHSMESLLATRPLFVEEMNTLDEGIRGEALRAWLRAGFTEHAASLLVYQLGAQRSDGGTVGDPWEVEVASESGEVLREGSELFEGRLTFE